MSNADCDLARTPRVDVVDTGHRVISLRCPRQVSQRVSAGGDQARGRHTTTPSRRCTPARRVVVAGVPTDGVVRCDARHSAGDRPVDPLLCPSGRAT